MCDVNVGWIGGVQDTEANGQSGCVLSEASSSWEVSNSRVQTRRGQARPPNLDVRNSSPQKENVRKLASNPLVQVYHQK